MEHLKKIIVVFFSVIFLGACEKKNNIELVNQCSDSPAIVGRFVEIPAGEYTQSASPVYSEERISKTVKITGFYIQAHEVTVGQFAKFVNDTGYITDVERSIAETRHGAGTALFTEPNENSSGQWSLSTVSSWQVGPTALENYPVVHVSYNDAKQYAKWAGGRLPSEKEWEYVAWLGLPDKSDQNSGAYNKDGKPIANTWQGVFPVIDQGSDGFKGVAPVGCFAADKVNLFDMIGNVWEWTSSPFSNKTHTIKGGSFLCSSNFCGRYRPAARQPHESDFSSNHIGFRVVKDL